MKRMPAEPLDGITRLLTQWSNGDHAALDELMPLVYDELRREFDAALIDAALAENAGRRVRAAEQLGLGRNTLTRKVGASRRRKRK